jgi:Subtilase family
VVGSRYTATGANLATVAARYYADTPQSGYLFRYPLYAFELPAIYFVPAIPVSAPLQRTEYVSAGTPALYWVAREYMANDRTLGGGDYDADRSYSPGANVTEGWNEYPLHPSLDASALGSRDISPTYLSATRTGDTLMFSILPFGDNTPGHTGEGYWPGEAVPAPGGITGSYELDQNGAAIDAGNADQSAQGYMGFTGNFTVTAAPATFRLTLTADRAVTPYVLSTRTSTVWTWRSAQESGSVLPAGWVCGNGGSTCASQPLMTLDYDVAGLGTNGVAPAGAQVVKVSVGHQQLATASATKSVTAQFSVDDGMTWQPATVKGVGRTWYASFGAPAGTKVSLKVSAADSSGGAITETIDDAYAISSQPASAGYRSANCAQLAIGHVSCYLVYSPQTAAARAAAAGFGPAASFSAPAGWGATDIEKAYRLPVTRRGGTVAVVEMYDTPELESYLNTYRKQYGLPPCTTANGCFRKVNEHGQAAPLPPNGTGSDWDLEATLDVDMVSAACPKCHILVVEAEPGSWADFANAENTAARLGAVAISNSYGTRETGQVQTYASAYNHPGHTIVASSGDYGFTAASFPANLAAVTAAGGTQLSTAHNARGYSERVWNDPSGASGSGCSAYVAKPSWQHDDHCPGRTVADVSAVATGIAIYEPTYAQGGWLLAGGTSAASPLIAGIYALAGNATTVKPGYEYAHAGAFFDVTAGNNDWVNDTGGATCGDDYLCVAKKGYDAPTGLGTPDGIGGL